MPSFCLPFSIWKFQLGKSLELSRHVGWVLCDSGSGGKSEKKMRAYSRLLSPITSAVVGWSSPAAPEFLSKCPRGGLFVSEVTFCDKAGTLYRHVWSMFTRVIDWREAGRHQRCSTRHCTTEQFWIWSLIDILKLNSEQDFETKVRSRLQLGQDFEAEVWARFWSSICINMWYDLKAVTLSSLIFLLIINLVISIIAL